MPLSNTYPTTLNVLANPSSTQNVDDSGFELDEVVSRIHDILEAHEQVLGADPVSGDRMGYVRIANGAGKGIYVPTRALMIPNPIISRVWQNGTTFTGLANNDWMADNWVYLKSGAVVHDGLRSTDVPTFDATNPYSVRGTHSIHLDVTTADSSIAAGDYAVLATRIEGYDWQDYDQQIFTLSFWVKAAKTGAHYVYVKNSGNDRTCVGLYTIVAADTWEWKAITFPASPSAGTWDYTNGRGAEIGWTQYAGSTFHTTAGAWQTGDYKGVSGMVNEVDSTANNFRLFRPRISLGSYALPPQNIPLEYEIAKAGRYFQIWNRDPDAGISGAALVLYPSLQGSATTVQFPMLAFHVPMRAVPTFSHNAGAWNATANDIITFDINAGGYHTVSSLNLTLPYATTKIGQIQANNITSGAAGHVASVNIGQNVKLMLSARIP